VPRARVLLLPLLICALMPSNAHATPTASLHVGFSPDSLGHSTNVEFNVDIAAPAGRIPPPLTELDLRYPRDLGFAISGLGLDTCSQQTLETLGPEYCPADSHMGQGSALAEITIGPEPIEETADVTIVRAPEEQGHIGLLFYATAHSPVTTEIAFPGQLRPATPPADESIQITIPLVASLPEAPYVSIVKLHATFGPRGLTYYEHLHGKLVPYNPQGILLPNKCPHGGFPFSATLGFLNDPHITTRADVPCAPRR
jgi:hypothetical protein